jgi:glutathione synthase/RimK-type ligase-like ATP-grasp enzyme
MSSRIALVSAAEFAHLDDDLPLITSALDALGDEVVVPDWHDKAFDWTSVDLAVVRSTWDYTWHLPEFLDWAEVVSDATVLANPFEVIRWNVDKRYLVELARVGLPVTPTTIIRPGEQVTLPEVYEVVVKPTVSAGARDTERYPEAEHDAALAHAEHLLSEGRSVLLQPYLKGIDERGETALVFAGGEYSHAFNKGPILTPGSEFVEGLYREESITSREASPAERAVADRVLDALPTLIPGVERSALLFARVDLAPGPDDTPVVLELELVEPSFFCGYAPGSAVRIAGAISAAAMRAARA